jgi:hypothetical protein
MQVLSDWYYGCGEFGAEGLEDESVMREFYSKEWLPQNEADEKEWSPNCIVGAQTGNFHYFFYDTQNSIQDWITESQRHQAYATRLMAEAFRRDSRMVTFAIHLFIDAFPSGWMKTIMDFKRNPKPAFFEYKNALEPVMISLRSDRLAYFNNEKIDIESWVCNDTNNDLSNCELVYELYNDDKVIATGRNKCKSAPCDTVFNGNISFVLNKVNKSGKYILKAFMISDDVVKTFNTLEFNVFPTIEIPKSNYKILDFESVTADTIEKVKKGMTLVVSNLKVGEHIIADNCITVKECGMLPVHFVSRKTGHKYVEEFSPYDFRMWYNNEADMITPIAAQTFIAEGVAPILTTGNLDCKNEWETVMVLGECFYGKGKIIISTLDFEKMDKNPVCKKLLSNIVD